MNPALTELMIEKMSDSELQTLAADILNEMKQRLELRAKEILRRDNAGR